MLARVKLLERRARISLFVAPSIAVICFSCGGSPGPSAKPAAEKVADEAPTSAAAESSMPAHAPKSATKEKRPIDPKTVGTVHGVIALDGTPPERKEMAIGNTAGCEKHPVPPLTEDVIAKDGKLANVFVYIKSGFDEWIVPPPSDAKITLNQEGCMYRPRVIGLRVGETLLVKNSDPANHNVHSRPERNDGFNQTQAPGSPPVEWRAVKPELMIPFSCDIHPWMKAWVSVRDTPWFAVTGEDGAFTISGVPPGEYTIEACHEKYGKKLGKLTLDPSGSAAVNITFSAK